MPVAYIMSSVVYYPALEIGDVRIDAADGPAAEAYGFARPEDLAGCYLSDLQTLEARKVGRHNHALRAMGHDIPTEYATVIRRPDGEFVGQRRRLVSQMRGYQGGLQYLTAIETVKELEAPRVPDLASRGVSEESALTHTGKFTVAQVRAMSRELLAWTFGEKLSKIITECARLSTTYYGWPPGRGLDFLLRRDLCTWSLSEKAGSLVYLRCACDACGRWWDSKRPPGTVMCPSCKTHLERARRMGEAHRVDRRHLGSALAAVNGSVLSEG